MDRSHQLLAEWLFAACWLEATARKPGNVHPEAAFPDLKYDDFVLSAKAAAPVLAQSRELGVGRAIFEAVSATRRAITSNSNLGMILLLAPLAAVSPERSLSAGIGEVLEALTVEDAAWAYRAIRTAHPGGMGEVADQDVASEPTLTLREVMALAADRDLIALQYVSNFSLVLGEGLSEVGQTLDFQRDFETAIIRLQLRLLARHLDSLIVRKCGIQTANDASARVQRVLESGWPENQAGAAELVVFDQWLRADGNRRNPGTTADLIAAILFAAFRDGVLEPPQECERLGGSGDQTI